MLAAHMAAEQLLVVAEQLLVVAEQLLVVVLPQAAALQLLEFLEFLGSLLLEVVLMVVLPQAVLLVVLLGVAQQAEPQQVFL
jgi:hypothetical protein